MATWLIVYVGVIALMFLGFGFLNKRQSAKKMALVNQIEVGVVIETIGGIRGKVVSKNEETIVIKSKGSELEFNIRAVGSVVTENNANPEVE